MKLKTSQTDPTTNGSIFAEDVQRVDVTPELAAHWLTHNRHNRSLREPRSQSYALDMSNGDWRWTGESIKWADNADPCSECGMGLLLDGQHRLRAIVISNTTQPMLVVRGLQEIVQEDIDTGVPRRFHDVLKLRGESNYFGLAALVRAAHAWESGHRRAFSSGGGGTNAQLLRTLEAHPELRDFVLPGARVGKSIDAPPAIISLTWWLFSQLEDDGYGDANYFFTRLADGQGLVQGDAIYELRRVMARMKEDVRGERSRTYLLAIIIKAWNFYRSGDPVAQLRWRAGGAKPEPFPEPR